MRFAGYAAVFDHPDGGGDVVRRGAFAASLARGVPIPLLWQHQAGRVIGRIEHLSEDRRGLRVIAELGEGDDARRAGSLLRSGRLDGLSFGYRVREAGKSGGLRELTRLELVEVSLVAEPMPPSTLLTQFRRGVGDALPNLDRQIAVTETGVTERPPLATLDRAVAA